MYVILADANRVRQDVPASGDGAAQPHQLRSVPRRYNRPPGQIKPPERTSDWIKVGGKVTMNQIALKEGDMET